MKDNEEMVKCYAPIFKEAPFILCIPIVTSCMICIAGLSLVWIITGSQKCQYSINKLVFRMQNCRIGNDDPNLDLNLISDIDNQESCSTVYEIDEPAIQSAQLPVENIDQEISTAPSDEWADDQICA